MNEFLKRAMELKDVTIKDRRYLHENAELGVDLPMTTQYIIKRLKEIGLEPKEICKSAVTATIYGKKTGKTILLRCDTDALPMNEDNDLPFRTKTAAAHTCGHDMHAAMALTAAQILKENEDKLCGNVKLMFQPGEEIFSGAKPMIEAGILENPKVDVAIGLHTMLDLPSPSLGYCEGNMTSSCDGFKITIKGSGCHGATPHMGIDPLNAAVHMYLSFQGLIAREAPPMESTSLTLGQLSGGSSPNIIPNEAVLQGTLRTYNKDVQKNIVKRMHEITDATAAMFNVETKYEELSSLPSTYTDPKLLNEMLSYVKNIDDNMVYLPDYKVTPSDDFAFIAENVPTVYFMLGCKVDGCNVSHHNPQVLFNEDSMVYGVALHCQCAINWLKDNQ